MCLIILILFISFTMSSKGKFYQAVARVVEQLGLIDRFDIEPHVKQLFDLFEQEQHYVTFGEAFEIDCQFAEIYSYQPNGCWLKAYGNPTNGYNELNGRKFFAANCGFFTFDLVDPIDDKDNDDDFDSIVDKFIQDHKSNKTT